MNLFSVFLEVTKREKGRRVDFHFVQYNIFIKAGKYMNLTS